MKEHLSWFIGPGVIVFILISGSAFADMMINVNTATIEQLSTLKGVGQVRAEAIVAYRETYGPFQSIDQLKNVKGIGDKIIEDNRPRLRLHDSEAATQGQKSNSKDMRANTKH